LTSFLADVSPDIPWHVTAFRRDYKMTTADDTRPAGLERAAQIGARNGLNFVYAGNRPGEVGALEDTRCPGCATTLVARTGFSIREYRVTATGRCPRCDRAIPGRWSEHDSGQTTSAPYRPASDGWIPLTSV
jgi:pyruvate formate lyase activating enzyme